MENLVVITLFIAAIFLLPLWRIYHRAGLNPYLSLTLLIPVFGFLIVCLILAISPWKIQPEEF